MIIDITKTKGEEDLEGILFVHAFAAIMASVPRIDYIAVGRKLLLVEEIPQGALARYERDVAAIAHIHRRIQKEIKNDE